MRYYLLTAGYLIVAILVSGCNFERRYDNQVEVAATPSSSPSPIPTPTGTPIPTVEPKFSSLNEKVFRVKCLNCHHSGNQSGDVNFSSYSELMNSFGTKFNPVVPKDPSNSGIVITVENDKMPSGNNEKLAKEEKEAMRTWVLNGALED